MFCDNCGAQLQSDYNLCPKCGKPIAAQSTTSRQPATSTPTRLERHLRTLGIFWIVAGALFLIPSFVLLAIGSAVHFSISGEEMVRELGPLALFLIGGSLLVVAAGGICIGWGLMQRQPWARIAALILGVLALVHIPFGTALGIYTLWVLLANDAAVDYQKMARAA